MQAGDFIKKVKERAGLEDKESAKKVIDAVFGALRARISHECGDNLSKQLPIELQEMWEKGFFDHIRRRFTGFERMNLQEFLERVRKGANLGESCNSENVTRAVFITLREAVSPGIANAIASQLPDDIKELWLNSVPESKREVTNLTGTSDKEIESLHHSLVSEEGTETAGEPIGMQKDQPAGEYGSDTIGPSAASIDRSDDQIATDIEKMLEVCNDIQSNEINVEVHAGKVKIIGSVPSQYEKQHAAELVSKVLGVTRVENDLETEQEKHNEQ